MSNNFDPDQDHQNPDLLSADDKSHPSKERSFIGLVLDEDCFESTIYFIYYLLLKKNRSLFMLQVIIFNNWSTENSKKTKGFFKK